MAKLRKKHPKHQNKAVKDAKKAQDAQDLPFDVPAKVTPERTLSTPEKERIASLEQQLEKALKELEANRENYIKNSAGLAEMLKGEISGAKKLEAENERLRNELSESLKTAKESIAVGNALATKWKESKAELDAVRGQVEKYKEDARNSLSETEKCALEELGARNRELKEYGELLANCPAEAHALGFCLVRTVARAMYVDADTGFEKNTYAYEQTLYLASVLVGYPIGRDYSTEKFSDSF